MPNSSVRHRWLRTGLVVASCALGLGACGSDATDRSAASDEASDANASSLTATTGAEATIEAEATTEAEVTPSSGTEGELTGTTDQESSSGEADAVDNPQPDEVDAAPDANRLAFADEWEPDPVTGRRSDQGYLAVLAAGAQGAAAAGAASAPYEVVAAMTDAEAIGWADEACDFVDDNQFGDLAEALGALSGYWASTDQDQFGSMATFMGFVTVTAQARCPGAVDELLTVLEVE